MIATNKPITIASYSLSLRFRSGGRMRSVAGSDILSQMIVELRKNISVVTGGCREMYRLEEWEIPGRVLGNKSI